MRKTTLFQSTAAKALLVAGLLGLAGSAHAGFDTIDAAPGSDAYRQVQAVAGQAVTPGSIVRVGDNGTLGFKLPDGSVFVLGDLHSTRTDVGGIEIASYTPATGDQPAVVEIVMTEGNLAIDTSQAPGTRVLVRTRDSVVEVPPNATVCVTALPAGARKSRRTLTAVRSGQAVFRNNSGTSRTVTSAGAVASNGRGGAVRSIVHPYNDCCGFLDPIREAAMAGPNGIAGTNGPVALSAPAPVPATPVAAAPSVPAAGGVAAEPLLGSELLIGGAIGAAAIGAGIAAGLAAGDDDAPAAASTTTTTN